MARDYQDFDIINHERLSNETPEVPLYLDYRRKAKAPEDNIDFTRRLVLFVSLASFVGVLGFYCLAHFLVNPWVILGATAVGVGGAIWFATKAERPWLGVTILVLGPTAPILLGLLGLIVSFSVGRWVVFVLASSFSMYVVDRMVTHIFYWHLCDIRLDHKARADWRAFWARRFRPLWQIWLRMRSRKLSDDGKSVRHWLAEAKARGVKNTFKWAEENVREWSTNRWADAVTEVNKYEAARRAPRAYLLVFYPLVLVAPFAAMGVLGVLASLSFISGWWSLILTTLMIALAFLYVPGLSRGRGPLAGPLQEMTRTLLCWFTYDAGRRPAPGVFCSPAGSRLKRIVLGVAMMVSLSFAVLPLVRFYPILYELYPAPWDELSDTTWRESSYFRTRLEGHDTQEFRSALNRSARAISTRTMVEHPPAWMLLAVQGAMEGRLLFFWALLVAAVACALTPMFLLTLSAGPVLAYLSPLIKRVVAGGEIDPEDWWDAYVTRLRTSPNVGEREHLWLGTHRYEDYPVLLYRKVLAEHAYIVGDTGSGKTALGVTPLVVQLIRFADAPVVIIDLKGDNALLQAAHIEASSAGLPFKLFTNELGRATHTFNPLMQGLQEKLSLNQVCENILEALNLNHGEGYGRSYYSRVARRWLNNAITRHPHIKSFTELHELAIKQKSVASPEEQRDAFEIISVIEILASFDQLNLTPQTRSYDQEVMDNAIYMPTVLAKNQIVYFWLPAAVEAASVREIAKLGIYALLTAAYRHLRDTGEPKQSYLVIDEFQRIASANFKIVLEQARSMGIGAILANQTMADLVTADVDLRPTVQTNTRFKQCFSATDLEQQERIMTASGEAIDLRKAHQFGTKSESTTLTEYTRARLQRNDVIRASDDPFQSIVQVHRGNGYTQYSGFSFPVRGMHMFGPAEYKKRSRAPWPEIGAGTIVVKRKPLEAFTSAEERVEAAKEPEKTVLVPEGQPDFGAKLRALHLEQLRQMGRPADDPATA